jgi:hypothetical protein
MDKLFRKPARVTYSIMTALLLGLKSQGRADNHIDVGS